jgi:hypothetical protein
LKKEVRPLQGGGVSIGIEQFDPLRVREYTLLELKRIIVRRGDDPTSLQLVDLGRDELYGSATA